MAAIDKRVLPPSQRRFRPVDESSLGFGNIYSDHMFCLDYHDGAWRRPRIEPFGFLSLSPAAMCLHYGQEVFEGMKCYRQTSGALALFRPRDNFERLNLSARRVCIPPLDEELCLAALRELILTDQEWVPRGRGTSLYIRPFIIATEPHLGVRPSDEYLFIIITGPVGAYYAAGFAPIKIYVEPHYTRTAHGGLGEIKTGGNYAASLLAAEEAGRQGFSQILWLDPKDHKYVEEVGSMNMFFVIDDEVITPPLSGTILAGVTRDSVLTLARGWGLKATERLLSIDEILEAGRSGRLKEAFGTGTACVISPVGWLSYKGQEVKVGEGGIGGLTQRLYDEILGLQYGDRPDSYDWVTLIK
jgi:branched-chain amino acid aminotransferase